ncbi:MAG: type II and III secretion system protein family protein [Alphaproteobacteria bacterium]|nr:type II and III secretion system protein family protein [Alphaproteobacteria bacterium]
MVRSRLARVLSACLIVLGLNMLSHEAFAASKPGTFYVPINRSELLTTSVDMGEVIITDPEVADVYVHGKNKVSVIGKQIGQTTLRVFDGKSRLIRSVDVYVVYDLPAIRKALREFLPYERIGVEMVNTRIALTGEVSSAETAATAVEIAEQFVAGKLTKDEAKSRPVRDGDAERSPILNLMKITAGQQVMLRIRIGEIQRTALKNLGVNLQAVKSGSLSFNIGTGGGRLGALDAATNERSFRFGSYQASNSAFSGIGIQQQGGQYGLGGLIEALEQDGLFKVLAEPNLVALSGEQAEFLAGGEFPIPVPQDGDSVTIQYKPFGVALKFTPYVLSENRIRVQVQPEVSEISNERTFTTTDGFVAPSLITRRASTTVELAPGEGFMIAGLIRDTMVSQINQLPGAGEIPVLSALFRSASYQRNETELVIAVTPYLVDPTKAGDIKLPTDDFRPASFMESIFYGALGAPTDATPTAEGPVGFMVD